MKLDDQTFPDPFDGVAEDINSALEALRSRKVSTVGAGTDPIKPKVVWKLETYTQGLVWRSVALGDGVCLSWSNGNHLSAAILARSVIESAAMAWLFRNQLSKAVETGDIEEIDRVAMSRVFSTRLQGFADGFTKAPNILSLIDKLDKEFMHAPKERMIRNTYDYLSEFVHPNWSSVTGLFGELDKDRKDMAFGDKRHAAEKTFRHMLLGTNCLFIIENCCAKVDEYLPRIWEVAVDP